MSELSPFDARPDPGLGAELRAALDGPDAEAFLGRVRAALAEAGAETPWDVLAAWAPRGLVAAVAAAAMLWLLADRSADLAPPALPAPVASAPVQMEVSPTQSEAVVLTVSLLEGR